MLGDNIKILRKLKGYSQETLAGQLNVVRQTISKWEKGLSVPDAEMLHRLSELFEVPVSQMLGSNIAETEEKADISEIAKQLSVLNEQLASTNARRRKTLRKVTIGVAIGIFVIIFIYIFCFWMFSIQPKKDVVLMGRVGWMIGEENIL